MNGKLALLAGVVIGAIVATTPQGKDAITKLRGKADEFWKDPRVQKVAADAQDSVADVIPGVPKARRTA